MFRQISGSDWDDLNPTIIVGFKILTFKINSVALFYNLRCIVLRKNKIFNRLVFKYQKLLLMNQTSTTDTKGSCFLHFRSLPAAIYSTYKYYSLSQPNVLFHNLKSSI